MNKQEDISLIRTICFVAGRSGGHIIPALTLAQEHKKSNPVTKIIFFSTATSLDNHIIKNETIVDEHIALAIENVPYKKIYRLPLFIGQLIMAYFKALSLLWRQKPQKLVSMGGYISLPVCLAAKTLRIPIDLYELNAVPGKATKALSPLANQIIVCFEKARQHFPIQRCFIQSYPVRSALKNASLSQNHALTLLRFSPVRVTLLVVGGSQGSMFINNLMKQFIYYAVSLHKHIQIIHQTGEHETNEWQQFYNRNQIPALVFAYHHAMEQYYQAADLIICRAGAGTLWEIVSFEKKAITIPLETTVNNHQVDNAYAIAQQYPALFTVMRQDEFAQKKSSSYNCLITTIEQIHHQKTNP